MNSYKISPKKNPRPAVTLCILFLTGAFLCYVLSARFAVTRAIGQLLAAVFLLLFVQISTKHLLTEYTYSLEDGVLSLLALQGKRIRFLGSVPLTADCLLLTKKEWKKQKEKYPLSARLSCMQNLFAERAFVLLCPNDKKYTALFFEPDEVLEALILEQIKAK